jgi:hypothetical protein
MNQFPPSPEYPIRIISIIFENLFVEIFASQGALPVLTTVSTTLVAKLPLVSTAPAANLSRHQRHPWQILPPVSLVLLILVANLPLVSTIPAILAAILPPV